MNTQTTCERCGKTVGCSEWDIHTCTPPAAQPALKPLTADDLREPKNGEKWRVEWWNESCRMLLPSDMRLDAFQSYKNGTLQFTIKRIAIEAAHGIKGAA